MSNKITLLIVDDHTLFRQGLKGLLESVEGFEVIGEACDGKEAVEEFAGKSPDVTLMDLGLPGVDGSNAIKGILQKRPEAKILVLTMYLEPDKVIEAIQSGARGYVLKDCRVEDLARAIRAVYSGEGYFSPQISAVISDEIRRSQKKQRANLTPTEIKVLSLLAQGLSNEDIGKRLYISSKTVRNRVSIILAKLGLKNRSQAALYALKEGLVSLHDVNIPPFK